MEEDIHEARLGIKGHHSQRKNNGTNGHEAMILEVFLIVAGIVNNARFYGFEIYVVGFTNVKTLSNNR